jgi:hypothetical protein
MRTFGRVCQIVVLLLGFYALCAVLVVGLVVADVLSAMAAEQTCSGARSSGMPRVAGTGRMGPCSPLPRIC